MSRSLASQPLAIGWRKSGWISRRSVLQLKKRHEMTLSRSRLRASLHTHLASSGCWQPDADMQLLTQDVKPKEVAWAWPAKKRRKAMPTTASRRGLAKTIVAMSDVEGRRRSWGEALLDVITIRNRRRGRRALLHIHAGGEHRQKSGSPACAGGGATAVGTVLVVPPSRRSGPLVHLEKSAGAPF